MKIAILCFGFLELGGGEIVLADLATRLSREGNAVFVVGNFGGFEGMSNSYRMYRVPRLPFEAVSRVIHLTVAPLVLLFIHLVNRVDVVQVAGLTDLFASFPVKVLFQIPVVLRLSMWKHPKLAKRLKTAVCLMADSIIAVSSDMKTELIEGGFMENQIVVIPNGVDIDKFRPSLRDRRKIILLWVGRLDFHKQPSLAVEALALIKNECKNVCLQIAGQGCAEKHVRKLVSRYGLHNFVEFLGYQNHDKVAEIMGNTDVFLMTSKGEGMSNALLEAMACGMVVVTTSASSIDVVQNRVNGFTANNPEDMASIVLQLIDDEVLKRKIGENARRTVMEKFSTDRMFSAYLQLYEKSMRK